MVHPARHFAISASLLCYLIGAAQSGPLQAAVYRCIGPADTVQFEQFGCPPHAVHGDLLPDRSSFVQIAPISELEQQQLDSLAARLERDRSTRQKLRQRLRAEQISQHSQSQRQCEKSRTELARLARVRRSGYPVASDRGLSEEEARWENSKREHC